MKNFEQPKKNISTFENAIATSFVINSSNFTFKGAIYDKYGSICLDSQRTKTGNNEWMPNDPTQISIDFNAKFVSGKSIYLGNYTGHFGHFLLESLSRVWALRQINAPFGGYDNFIFHPFLHKSPAIKKFLPAKISFDCFGIQQDKTIIINEPLRFESLTVPSSLFHINQNAHPDMAFIYKDIYEYCKSTKPSTFNRLFNLLRHENGNFDHLYLSRRKTKGYRPMANEKDVERIFLSSGFRIIHPEKCSFEQLVCMFQKSCVIAGIEGSGLHNSVFMRPHQHVISIGTLREPSGNILNQQLCDALSNVQTHHIPFLGVTNYRGKAIYDIKNLATKLTHILKANIQTF